jgi:hypothetical protein
MGIICHISIELVSLKSNYYHKKFAFEKGTVRTKDIMRNCSDFDSKKIFPIFYSFFEDLL